MHVDVDVELARQLEDALDLAGAVGVVARRAADHLGAALQRLDQQFVGAGIVGQAFLREHADLDVDRPLVVGDQRLHASKPRMPMPGSTSTCVRMRVVPCTMHCSSVSRGARVHVLDRHVLLERRDADHGAERGALLRRAAVDDARLVEMDVGLDQAGTGEPPLGVVACGVGARAALDRDDAAALDADVQGPSAGGRRGARCG